MAVKTVPFMELSMRSELWPEHFAVFAGMVNTQCQPLGIAECLWRSKLQ